jgi:putative transposase
MKKQASHTEPVSSPSLRLLPEMGLVDLADPSLAERLAGKVSEQLEAFAGQMRQGLLAASVAIGLDVMAELQEAEVTDLAGPKGRHDPNRTAYRHGTEEGKVTLGGRRVPLRRPRVRSVGGDAVEREVHLESYDTFASVDLLADHMVASMLAGLSGRRYQRALEPVGEEVEASSSGTSQSSVSRRFIAATAERLAEFRSRPLDDRRWLICFIDGFDFAGHTMVGALGVTADGTKVPLGVVDGSTENATVVRHLVTGLRERGLDASEGILFVLDGAKALKTAVSDVFGDHAVIARCRTHYADLRIMPMSARQPLWDKGIVFRRSA